MFVHSCQQTAEVVHISGQGLLLHILPASLPASLAAPIGSVMDGPGGGQGGGWLLQAVLGCLVLMPAVDQPRSYAKSPTSHPFAASPTRCIGHYTRAVHTWQYPSLLD